MTKKIAFEEAVKKHFPTLKQYVPNCGKGSWEKPPGNL
ncbi:hypothetical protein HVS_02295 [Acetivibrio saccincola]|jgi:hypothetical protein|uniref:Uncharacterized protein n=1 Tax=Acetivibrio saccincola TaxID=1677857 RepID=A0A2K9E8U6_9FIRM|nr:hypothetical protein HVS_02295 [Acetivibrio saccincola]